MSTSNLNFIIGVLTGLGAATIFLSIYTDFLDKRPKTDKPHKTFEHNKDASTQTKTRTYNNKETQVNYDLADFIVVDYCPRM